MAYDLNMLLKTMLDQNASDLHLTVGCPPSFRIHGQIVRTKSSALTAEDTAALCHSLLTDAQMKKFEEKKELDFAFGLKNVARVRANIFVQRGTIAAVFRRINSEIPALNGLGFNSQIQGLVDRPAGLVLVTGATGSGKSTTIAAFLDKINQTKRSHIITIEDPIEFTHSHKKCIVNQREIGTDCDSFGVALRQVLREDPDVIMVGEMRDSETTDAAIRAAETGHLVFSTLHTNGAIASINRLVQMFRSDAQEYVRSLLALTLEGVVSQALLERADKHGRVMCFEYLGMTPAIRNLIRENKLHQVYGQMQLSQDQHGMCTMNQSLQHLVATGVVTWEEALSHSPEPEEFTRMLSKSTRRAS